MRARLTRGPQAFWLVRLAAVGVIACAPAPWAALPGRSVPGTDGSGRATLAMGIAALVVPALAPVLWAAALEAGLGAACLAVATTARTPYWAPALALTQLLGLVWAGSAAWGARTVLVERRRARAAAARTAAPPPAAAPAAPPGAPAPPL